MSYKFIYNNKNGCIQKIECKDKKNNDTPTMLESITPVSDTTGSLELVKLTWYMKQWGITEKKITSIDFSKSIIYDNSNGVTTSEQRWNPVLIEGFVNNDTSDLFNKFLKNTLIPTIDIVAKDENNIIITHITFVNVKIQSYKIINSIQYITFLFESITYTPLWEGLPITDNWDPSTT
jgi:hypothetical protein